MGGDKRGSTAAPDSACPRSAGQSPEDTPAAAVRGQFGARLAGVYAPVRVAVFGSGAARIDVRTVAPDGAAAYLAALATDIRARKAAGVPLRSADITGAAPGSHHPVSLQALMTILRAQRPPYLPSSLEIVRIPPSGAVLRIGYPVPSPLGLLGSGG